jgi:ABC-2 type transport system ATP-binding protein
MTPTTTSTTTTQTPATTAAAEFAPEKPGASTEMSSAAAAPVSSEQLIVFEDVSKFYGEILGVNRVNLRIASGITSLVGPNGSGKTTLMNLMTGLLKPTQGRVSILGTSPDDPEALFQKLGYCSQFDSFPRGATAREFIEFYLRVHGYAKREVADLAQQALERVSLTEAAERKVSAFSKGMRQRVRLAQAIAHNPSVLVLDEPLNGLDPMARAEIIRLFRELADAGMYLIISSHILHEVDMMSDSVVLIHNGYVVAEGDVHGVRDEIDEHPIQILIRCDRPQALAARLFEHEHTVEARIHNDRSGLFVKTRRPDDFYLLLNKIITELNLEIESVAPVDDDLNAVYQYLIASDGGQTR